MCLMDTKTVTYWIIYRIYACLKMHNSKTTIMQVKNINRPKEISPKIHQ